MKYLKLDANDKKDLVLWYRTGRWTERALAKGFQTCRSVVHDVLKKYKSWTNKQLLEG